MISLNEFIDDHYDILVDVKKDQKTYQLPLADLELIDHRAPQGQVVRDCAVWFANR